MHLATLCTVLAATSVLATVCTVDDVLHSLQTLSDESALLPSAIQEPPGDSQDYDEIMGHLKEDLACDVQIPDENDQQRVCDAYTEYTDQAQSALDSLSDDPKDSTQPEIIHQNILTLRDNILDYTATLSAAVPACAQSINDAYVPLDDELEHLLQRYPEN